MSSYQKRVSTKIDKIAKLSYAEMKALITRKNLSIKKNLSANVMRTQIINAILDAERTAVQASKAAAAARVELKIAEAAENYAKFVADIVPKRAERRDARVAKTATKAERKEAARVKRMGNKLYFVSYEMRVKNDVVGEGFFYQTLFSFIADQRHPNAEAEARFRQWIATTPNTKGYEEDFAGIKQLYHMNVPIYDKKQLRSLEALTGAKRWGARTTQMQLIKTTLNNLKLKQRLYRKLHKIPGFPDTFDKNDGCCVPNFLAAECKLKRMSVDRWYKKKHPEIAEFYGADEYQWITEDIKDFAADHKRSCYLVDRTKFCFEFNIVENSSLTAIYALIEGSHVYPIINDGARKSISSKVRAAQNHVVGKETRGNAPKKVVDTRVPVYKKIVSDSDIFDLPVEDVAEVDADKLWIDNIRRAVKGEEADEDLMLNIKSGIWVQTGGKNLNMLLESCIANGYMPDIEIGNGGIKKITWENTCIIYNPQYEECIGTGFESHSSIAQNAFDEMVKAHPEMLSCNQEGVAHAKHWISEDIDPETHHGLDFSKFYYECAMRLEDAIPTFSVGSKQKCDKFVNDNSFYYVITDDTRLFRGSNYYSCGIIMYAMREGIEFTIDHKLAAAGTYDCEFIKTALNEVRAKFDGDLVRAKQALVRFIGMLARNKTTSRKAYLIPNNKGNEACLLYHYLTENSRGREAQVHMNVFSGMHMIESRKSTQLSLSCGSAHRLILDRSYIEMYKLITRENLWDKIVGVKTDCAIFRKADNIDLAGIVARNTELKDIPIKIEKVRKSEKVEMALPKVFRYVQKILDIVRENEIRDAYYKNGVPTDSESAYPWMNVLRDMLIHDIKCGKFVWLEGIAGAGKSYLAKIIDEVFTLMGFKVVKLASDWVAAANIGGSTFHTHFNLKNSAATWYSNIKCGDLTNTVFIIDEVSKLDKNLIALVDYLRSRAYAIIVMGDCEHQLLPIEKSLVSVEESLIEFADIKYVLEVCKRGLDIMEPALKIFEGVMPSELGYAEFGYKGVNELAKKFIEDDYERLICKSNVFRRDFNLEVCKLLSVGKETRNVRISTQTSVSTTETINVPVFVGMKLVSVYNDKNKHLIKSNMGFVLSLNPFTIQLVGIENRVLEFGVIDDFTLSDKLSKHFDIGYAITCYKCQSATYDFRYMITDFKWMCVRERFVACTRATKFDNILICNVSK